MHIASYLFHYSQSCGTTFAARGLSRALGRLGYRVTLYCCGANSERIEAERAELPNRQIVRYDISANPNPFYVPRRLLERIRRNEDKVDLLIIHGNFNPKNVAVARAARQAGLPHVVSPSSLYHEQIFRKHRMRKLVYGWLFEKPMLRGAAAIQVFTESQFHALHDYGVHTPAFAIPNGFDPEEISRPSAAEIAEFERSAARTPRLVYLGRIDTYTKGLDLLIQALATGIRSGSLPADLELHCTGPDWEGGQAGLQAMAAELGIANNVKFFGRVDDRQRWSVIFGSEIMVLASRHDSFPTTVIEAMAAGKPVIVSEETGISPLVKSGNCGFVVRPAVNAICDGIAEAIRRRSQWADMGRRGREMAYQHLTWDRIAQRARPHYEAIVRGESRNQESALAPDSERSETPV